MLKQLKKQHMNVVKHVGYLLAEANRVLLGLGTDRHHHQHHPVQKKRHKGLL